MPLPGFLRGTFYNKNVALHSTLIAFRMFMNGLEYLSTNGSICPVSMFVHIDPI